LPKAMLTLRQFILLWNGDGLTHVNIRAIYRRNGEGAHGPTHVNIRAISGIKLPILNFLAVGDVPTVAVVFFFLKRGRE
jgi:hypothetical protein